MKTFPTEPHSGLDADTLERIKLEREIADFDTPLIRKPAFYGVVGPTLLAAASLGLGFYTGLFDIERKKLESQTLLLKLEERDLAESKEQAERDLADARAELARQLKEERARNDAAIGDLQTSFTEEKAKLDAELQALNRAIELGEAELAQLRADLAAAPIRADLDDLRQSTEAIWQRDSMERLIEKAAADPDVYALIEAEFAAASDPRYGFGLLYLMHRAAPSDALRDRILAFPGDHPENEDVWLNLGGGYWEAEDQRVILNAAIALAAEGRMSTAAFKGFDLFFHLPRVGSDEIGAMLAQGGSEAFLTLGLGSAFDPRSFGTTRLNAVRMFDYLSARIGSVVAAMILTDADIPEEERVDFRLKLDDVLNLGASMVLADNLEATLFVDAYRAGRLEGWLADPGRREIAAALAAGDIAEALRQVGLRP